MNVENYLEKIRENIIDLYNHNQYYDKEASNKIKFLALDTIMYLDKCLRGER